MSESPPAKKIKKTEDDVLELLTRYSATTILSALREVHDYTKNHPDSVKIDWIQLCKNTSTGISNAREYQMLWRNLAYQEPLVDVENGAEILDDSSDLEIEIESDPHPTAEEASNAKECVNALLSSTSRLSSVDGDMHSSSPLLGSPDKQASPNCGGNTQYSNTTKKPSTAICDEGLDGNGHPNCKKKRQPWTKEEDDELKEAVKKCGEGNWANILKGDFKHNRTASQLSQRWALLRKKDCNTNNNNGAKVSSLARNEERLAAIKAFSMAIDMPMTGAYSGTAHAGMTSSSTSATSQASRACAAQSLSQSQDKTTPNIFAKSRPLLKKASFPTMKYTAGPNPLIQDAAFAAGGRIANPSTAASLLKAVQSKNVVRIGPGIQVCLTIPNNNSNSKAASVNLPVRPSSATVLAASSFGTTLSSMKEGKKTDIVEDKKTAASEESNAGESEIVVEKEVMSRGDGSKIEAKKEKEDEVEKSKEAIDEKMSAD